MFACLFPHTRHWSEAKLVSSHHLEHVGGNGIDLATEMVVGIENLFLFLITQSLSIHMAQSQCQQQEQTAQQPLGVHLC